MIVERRYERARGRGSAAHAARTSRAPDWPTPNMVLGLALGERLPPLPPVVRICTVQGWKQGTAESAESMHAIAFSILGPASRSVKWSLPFLQVNFHRARPLAARKPSIFP